MHTHIHACVRTCTYVITPLLSHFYSPAIVPVNTVCYQVWVGFSVLGFTCE